MTTTSPSRVAFVGCGNIAGPYAQSLLRHSDLSLIGVFDLDADKRAEFAQTYACADYSSLDQLCNDSPEIVVNLTNAPHHYATTLELIERGQTVFSEKPLALRYHEAQQLVEHASAQRVRLACAPSLWLGAAPLAAAEALRSGTIGTVRLINAEVNQGRIESWHPVPHSFYQVGPVVDAGVYPLAYLTAVFGPIRRVTATSATIFADRTTLNGEHFEPATADAWVATAEFASGPILRLSCNFYVDAATQPRTIDFHGDAGSLRLEDWGNPGAGICYADYGNSYGEYAPKNDTLEIDWCLGLADLASSIRENRPHQTGGEHAAHVVEVLEAIARSADLGTRVDVGSDFPLPLPESTAPLKD
jgi:predicted dehydrogenase